MKRFGVMLDMSRNGVMKPEKVKKFAKIIKDMGYNMLQLYTEDTYEIKEEPYFGYMRGRYTVEELKDIVNYCESIGVEVIPCIQVLAHLNQIFRWFEYAPINDAGDVLLVGEERTYKLIDNMFKTVKECFKSPYVHIGMDEAFMLGLGKYMQQHGFRNRFDILNEHLNKIVDMAASYGLKPIMWSDMFFRLANKGEYYTENPVFPKEIINKIPANVGLVYWDYYHADEKYYTKMIKAHKEADNELWFAGGGWTFTGFASGNKYTLETMVPAMKAVKKENVDNIFIAMWGDNGKECSYFSMLPCLYKLRCVYDGETDEKTIKSNFKNIVGEDYDSLSDMDIPNYVGGQDCVIQNIAKNMLYSDPFLGYLDSVCKEQVSFEYNEHAERLSNNAKRSKEFTYLYESSSALCKLMSVKYGLGAKTRKAYLNKDKKLLKEVIDDYYKAEELLQIFYKKFKILWFKENKPHGFDVQDIRLGGLLFRLKSCKERLIDYMDGKIDNIPELDEKLLDFWGNGEEFKKQSPCLNEWHINSTVNRMI